MIIRPFLPHEIEAYLEIRRQGLINNPDAFLTTLEGFERQPRSFYERRLQNNHDSADIQMLCAFDSDRPAGMMGLIRSSRLKQRHIAWIVAVYVDPHYRGTRHRRQIARRMYSAWARNGRG